MNTLPVNTSRHHMRRTASWILRDKHTKQVVCETYLASMITKLNTSRYEAIAIGDYLESLNVAVRQ